MIENIHWLGHDTFRIENDKTIYIDPIKLKGRPLKADLILITHDHFDHCSPDDVAKVAKDDTVIVTIAAAAQNLKGDVRVVKPGESLVVQGIPIETVPAYNVSKFRSPGVPFHPKESGHVGFIITVGGVRIYHAGDTDVIPEMDDIETDVALLPVGGTYTMTADEAAEAANRIQPQVAIPMHWGAIVGSASDAQRFSDLCQMEVVILSQEG
ncbi:MAG: MBL fold metallo-hydrolase [Anaerolineales bacterium]|nr:MAG: MBL fold metallo-hydrolase [Anaerolineales bacterium]